VYLTPNYRDFTLLITPAGTIAEYTLLLPEAVNARPGQIVRFFSTQIVTALTVSIDEGGGTIHGATLSAAAANTHYAYQCISRAGGGVWIRIH
jgi:hypothetical protein